MTDEYVLRDDTGITVHGGTRQDGDRRVGEDRRTHSHGMVGPSRNKRHSMARRQPGERRIGPVLTFADLLMENISALFLGLFLIVTGLCMLVTGLTFLPVVGLFAGAATLIIGAWIVIRAFKSRWPET